MTETSASQLLIPPTPRAVTRKVFWRSWAEAPVQIWWKSALLVVVVMAFVTFSQVKGYLHDKHLLETGTAIKAQIVELNDRKIANKGGGYKPSRDVENYAKLEGKLPDGQQFVWQGMLPKADGFAELGGMLAIRVDPHDLSQWVEQSEQKELWHPFMAVFLLAPIVLVLLAYAQWKRMGVVRVWKEGKVRDGYVVDTKHSAMAPRSRILRYNVPDVFDKRVFRMLYPAKYGAFEEGAILTMLVLPDQPGRAIVADFYVREVETLKT